MNIEPPRQQVPLTEILYQKASRLRLPLSGTFELSPVCNFACKMCYIRKTAQEVSESPRRILTLEDWRAIAREARRAGMLFLLLTGGEPFLWQDFWQLYEELAAMGFVISINSNGSMIDDEAVERLKRLPPRRIAITLYGAGDETYEALCGVKGVFEKVTHAIDSLTAAGIQVKVNASLTPDNAQDLEKLVDFCRVRGLHLDATAYMFPPIRRKPELVGENQRFTPEQAAHYRILASRLRKSPEQHRRFLQDILQGQAEPLGLDEGCVDPVDGRIRCRAGKASFWITWDGWLTPCGLLPEPKQDLMGGSFAECWEKLTQAGEAVRLSGVCGECSHQKICNPCAAMAVAETGETSGIPRYLCLVARQMRRIAARELEQDGDGQEMPVQKR